MSDPIELTGIRVGIARGLQAIALELRFADTAQRFLLPIANLPGLITALLACLVDPNFSSMSPGWPARKRTRYKALALPVERATTSVGDAGETIALTFDLAAGVQLSFQFPRDQAKDLATKISRTHADILRPTGSRH